MIPFDRDFEFPQARFLFGLNKLALPWMIGEPMPADLPAKIVDAMELGAKPQPEPEAVAARAQTPPRAVTPPPRSAVSAWQRLCLCVGTPAPAQITSLDKD